MALPVVEYFYGFPVLDPEDNFFDAIYDGSFTTATSARLVLETDYGSKIVFKGDFVVSGGVVTGGTVDHFKVFAGETKVMTESGLDISATALIDAVEAWQTFSSEQLDELLLAIPARYVGSEQDDFLFGEGMGTKILGRQGDDRIATEDVDTVLKGGKGNDLLVAESGFSWYSGGKGDDVFVFVDPATPNKITDFSAGDLIQLNTLTFEGVGQGFLLKGQFALGASASDEDQIILYQKGKGNLWYDQDGSGSTYDPVKFAKVDKGTDLSHKDFYGDNGGLMLA
jgi:Ca2+-binding RTX toxin-like protein